jgi:hypothetical protein
MQIPFGEPHEGFQYSVGLNTLLIYQPRMEVRGVVRGRHGLVNAASFNASTVTDFIVVQRSCLLVRAMSHRPARSIDPFK